MQTPKLRPGSFLPSILEPRRRDDQARYAVIMKAYIGGVSTPKNDALVAALGFLSGISKLQLSRICQEIDQQMQTFLSRPLESNSYACVYLDATYLMGWQGKALQVCSRAVVVAMGVNEDGPRVPGVNFIGARLPNRRRTPGVAGPHGGRQRDRVLLGGVHLPPQGARPRQATSLAERFPKAAALMHGAKEVFLALRHFPKDHWKKVWSTNRLERVNEEIKRRTRVVGIFAIVHAIIRLVVSVLLEQLENWQSEARRMFSAESMATHPGTGRHPCPASLQRLRAGGHRPQVIEAAAPPQGAAALTGRPPGPAAATPGCTDHLSSQHIGNRRKDLTR
jgi:hypothetical protein